MYGELLICFHTIVRPNKVNLMITIMGNLISNYFMVVLGFRA